MRCASTDAAIGALMSLPPALRWNGGIRLKGGHHLAVEPRFSLSSGLKRNDDRAHGSSTMQASPLRLRSCDAPSSVWDPSEKKPRRALSFLPGPRSGDQGDHHAAHKGSGYTDANDPAEGGGLGKMSHCSLADCRGLSLVYAPEGALPSLLSSSGSLQLIPYSFSGVHVLMDLSQGLAYQT